MQRAFWAGAASLVLCATFGRAGDDKDLRSIIARGLDAVGGEKAAAKQNALIMKGAGTFYGLGAGIPYTGQWWIQGDKQMRFALEIKAGDMNLQLVQVINGDKGWVKLNDQVMQMPADELAEEQHFLYASAVATLVPLKDKAFKLSALGEVQVDDKPAQGIRVSREGRRDVNLFFDKKTGLLVKSEYQMKDVKGGGKELSQEAFYQEYMEVDGIKFAKKAVLKRDGKLFVESDMTEIRPVDKIEAAMFERP